MYFLVTIPLSRRSGKQLFVSPAEDTIGPGCEEPSQQQRLLVAVTENKEWLAQSVKVAEGMCVMLTWNLVVSADLANGTQGTVEKIYLDPQENVERCGTGESIVYLQYPPAVVLFHPDKTPVKLEGLQYLSNCQRKVWRSATQTEGKAPYTENNCQLQPHTPSPITRHRDKHYNLSL
jgi:hypothetical protein